MMGVNQPQVELFSYKVNLDKRIRADHPLRRVAAEIDFTFIRAEVAACYGHNGHVSIDPAILLKMMFLLFFDDITSERELMKIIPERLDYLWFLGYGLDDEIPNHSVLSKARARWGKDAFEKFFTRTIAQCVQARLVDGRKLMQPSDDRYRGGPDNPFTREDLKAKFEDCASLVLAKDRLTPAFSAIETVDSGGDVRQLVRVLTTRT